MQADTEDAEAEHDHTRGKIISFPAPLTLTTNHETGERSGYIMKTLLFLKCIDHYKINK